MGTGPDGGALMRIRFFSLSVRIVFMLSVCLTQLAWINDLHERYVGILRHDSRNIQQLAKLEFIPHYVGDTPTWLAIFTLYFGGFDTDEYVSYTFSHVRFDSGLKQLVLSEAQEDISLKVVVIDKDRLQAKVTSSVGGVVGICTLGSELIPIVAEQIISRLNGRYEARCQDTDRRLVLQTYRNPGDSDRYGNPFHALRIKGQLGARIDKMCGVGRFCVINQITTGSYNFYDAYVNLSGTHGGIDCSVAENGDLNCRGCEYKKKPEEISKKIWPMHDPFVLPSKDESGASKDVSEQEGQAHVDIEDGEYQGYIYHENRQIFQAASMHFTHHKSEKDVPLISLSAVLYFGSCHAPERIPYRFNRREIVRAPFVFENLGYDVDAIIRIDRVGNDYVKGIWYSKIFGRVGTFFLSRKGDIPLPIDAVRMDGIGSIFDSKKLHLNLHTFQKSGFQRNENPFALMGVAGFFRLQSVTSTRFVITESSYDFYTGKFGLELENGLRASSGMVSFDQKSMEMSWSSLSFAHLMVDDAPMHFVRSPRKGEDEMVKFM